MKCLVYLGSALSASVRIGPELGRRLGLAQSDFRTLQRAWAHFSLPRADNTRIFEACIISKLCYGLEVSYLNTAE